MQPNRLIITALFLFITLGVYAQKGIIKGSLKTTDGLPAEFVNVTIKGKAIGAIANTRGEYELRNVAEGTHTLIVSFVGLETQEQPVEVKGGQTTIVPDIVLKETAQQLQEVVVQANANKYKSDGAVSSSLRLATPILETPQNIQVISKRLLADQQIFDMLEGVTRNISGVTRSEHWDNYALIMMRGSQATAFRNGMNVQMPWGPLAEDMSMVERIEFVKGPAGFMMANGEPSGFYNVVTKKPTGTDGGEASLTLGSFDNFRATLDLDGKLNKSGKLLYRVNLMGQTKGSHRAYEFNNRYSIVPVIKYQFSDKTSLTAEYTYQYMQMSMIGSAYAYSPKQYADLPINFTTTEPNLDPTNINDHSLFVTLNHQIDQNWKFTGQLAYLRYGQIGSSMWPSGFKSETGILQRTVSIWDALGLNKSGQVFVNGDVRTGGIRHRILAGVDMNQKDYYADWSQTFNLNGTQPFDIYHPVYGTVPTDSLPVFDRSRSIRNRGINYNQRTTGVYVQDELGFWDNRIRLTLAGRYTTANNADPYSGAVADRKFTPRIGLSVSLDKSTSVYALYDQAFVPQAGADYNGRKFEPITGGNLEAGLKREWFGGRWTSSVIIFNITKNNVLTSDPQHINFSMQLGQTKVRGVEVDIQGQLARNLDVVLNYAYNDSKVTKDTDPAKVGVPLAGTTKHNQNLWLSYRVGNGVLRGFGASLGYQWQIDRSSWYVFDGTKQSLPDYFRLDGAITWQKNRIRTTLNVNNLLNAYLYSGAPYTWSNMYYWQTEAGRNVRMTVAYKF